MKGSMLAGIAFGNSDVGAVHCISESIGALFDVPHGVANSIFLPYVMEFNLQVSAARYAEIARMTGIDEKNDNEAGVGLIKKIKDLSCALNIPVFKDLCIEEKYFQEIALKSFQNNSNSSNPRKAGVEDYMGILRQAYNLSYS
jgi:alcohol dehydrogenase